jgi:hypothetical protein
MWPISKSWKISLRGFWHLYGKLICTISQYRMDTKRILQYLYELRLTLDLSHIFHNLTFTSRYLFSSFFVTIDKHTKKITILRDMVSQLKAAIGFNGPRHRIWYCFDNYFTYFVPVFKYCYSDSRNLWHKIYSPQLGY